MSADMGTIAQLLDATLDPSQHKKGLELLLSSPPTGRLVIGKLQIPIR